MGTNYSSGGFLIGAYRGDLLRRMPEKKQRIPIPCRNCPDWEEGCTIGEENCERNEDGQTNGDN